MACTAMAVCARHSRRRLGGGGVPDGAVEKGNAWPLKKTSVDKTSLLFFVACCLIQASLEEEGAACVTERPLSGKGSPGKVCGFCPPIHCDIQ